MTERLISFVEAEMMEMLGWDAPVDEETVARLEANGAKKETASKKTKREEVVYITKRNSGRQKAGK